jgi:ubiquinone/menaquinone biosynthesis C-methylase UbiE
MSWVGGNNRATFLRLLSPGQNERILDVGSGKGDIAAMVQQAGSSEVYALDPDSKKINAAQKNNPSLKACVSGSESIPYDDGFFDKVYSTMAVHHFTDQEKSFREIARVMKPDGILVIVDVTPNSTPGRFMRLLENGVLRARLRFLTLEQIVGQLGRGGEFRVDEAKADGSRYFVKAFKRSAGGA